VWWIDDNQQLVDRPRRLIQDNVRSGLEISAISCWEVAKLVQYGRLELAYPVDEWMEQALAYPGVHLLELTPRMVVLQPCCFPQIALVVSRVCRINRHNATLRGHGDRRG
jgi:PIN domain nuclease of toxin-antitoxin system